MTDLIGWGPRTNESARSTLTHPRNTVLPFAEHASRKRARAHTFQVTRRHIDTQARGFDDLEPIRRNSGRHCVSHAVRVNRFTSERRTADSRAYLHWKQQGTVGTGRRDYG